MMELFFWYAGKDAVLPEEKQYTLRDFFLTYSKPKSNNRKLYTAPQNQLSSNSL